MLRIPWIPTHRSSDGHATRHGIDGQDHRDTHRMSYLRIHSVLFAANSHACENWKHVCWPVLALVARDGRRCPTMKCVLPRGEQSISARQLQAHTATSLRDLYLPVKRLHSPLFFPLHFRWFVRSCVVAYDGCVLKVAASEGADR